MATVLHRSLILAAFWMLFSLMAFTSALPPNRGTVSVFLINSFDNGCVGLGLSLARVPKPDDQNYVNSGFDLIGSIAVTPERFSILSFSLSLLILWAVGWNASRR